MAELPDPIPSQGGFRRHVAFAAFVVLGMAALFAAAWALRTLLLITFLAVLLAIVLRSLGDIVHRWTGMAPHWGVLLVAALLVLLAVGAAVLVAPTIADQARQLVQRLPAAAQALEQRIGQTPWLQSLWQQVSSGLSLPSPGDTVGQAGRIVGAISAALGYAGLALVGALFLALDPGLYRRGFVRLVPLRHRPFTERLLDELDRTILNWLGAQLILMLVIGVAVGVGLWAIGVPYALALGLFAGLVEFIPYLGPILSAGTAILVALGTDPTLVLWTIGLFIVVQQSENNILQPLIQKSQVEIPPVLLIVVLFGMGQLFGVPGVLVATPLLAVAIVVVRRVYVERILEGRTEGDAEPPRI
ncbi:AI-2E family transporter [Enterovirga aerilata]|uniref:AI-2E family transporter n=1 Tax=Enterovirga aerilata TaxID=2730920 RepID=A0A849I565_9HYPH|nr:AI-2E family transporter [Enterovirga sp. DB1703]NNM72518.1 AI-2E family transporter [Enterovirga sp. DB1703]